MLANSTMHLEEDVCEYALYCIAKGVQAMHNSNFVVQNLQVRNVVRHGNDSLQISNLNRCYDLDNGPACLCPDEEKAEILSPEEILDGKHGGKPSDIWAFGVIAYLVATGDTEKSVSSRQVSKESLEALDKTEGGQAQRSSAVSTQLESMFEFENCTVRFKEFIESCVQPKAGDRMTIDEILETQFMKDAAAKGDAW